MSGDAVPVQVVCDERLLRRMLQTAIQSAVALAPYEERAIADEFVRILRRGAHAVQKPPLRVHPYHLTEE